MRATVQNRMMSGAVGINTKVVDRLTFAIGCGIAGVAGAAFTTIGSTGPDSGSRYIVDTFLVVVFGGVKHNRVLLFLLLLFFLLSLSASF